MADKAFSLLTIYHDQIKCAAGVWNKRLLSAMICRSLLHLNYLPSGHKTHF